ncbi:probable membrane-associated kinase regulator 2 [Triticum urartu]|uniref:Membrane-associated kinase regulator 2 n=1 Tax=Triticum urartu TaxID=4572 RepID=A0A8R7PQT9_TRIUA|nr:probable membrane-associated kinase regulator 2 [Triticum urartu]XP_048562589.1 probable membrane-associated kinase regulator 2 [Triticum urartu]XP_048563720.1 probable membrane-associated kinase regulator 2 [Triticum urartu]XP_048566163.1 probable membrane-associated kinase regulator 2 [Triticum urartu]
MESFSLLKYLRGGAVAGNQRTAVPATTIAALACEEGGEGGGSGGGADVVEDDAAFFDLEFAVPGDESAASDAEEERVEFNFSVAGDAASGGEVVAVEPVVPVSEAENGVGKEAEPAATAEAPAASFLRPATKFRVLLLKLRKPKVPVPAEGNAGGAAGGSPAPKTNRFLIKFRVDDAPFVSLFTRDNSSRTSDAGAGTGAARPAVQAPQPSDAVAITAEERRFAKEVMLKYLNKIKPLYVKVSRRYGERLRFAGASEGEETDAEPEPSPPPSATPSPAPSQPRAAPAPPPQPVVVACGVRAPRASVPAGLKQACKRLGKSRSASSAVAAAPSPSATPPTPAQPQRRDDSLLQLQDGIQGAIAHCKRSFNASKGSESPLLRSMTEPKADGAADTKDGVDGA